MTVPPRPEDGPDDAEVDRAFREIVAGLRGPGPEREGPDREGPGRARSRRQEPPPQGPPAPRAEHHPDPSSSQGRAAPGAEHHPDPSSPQGRAAPRADRYPHPSSPQEPPAPRAEHYLNPPPSSHLGPGTPEGMATDHRSYEPPEEEDHFVPPDPPPLPAGDLHFWAIVVGLIGGPLLVVLSAVVPVLDRSWAIGGLLLSIAGFVLLVLRQPRYRGPDDGTHGAQV